MTAWLPDELSDRCVGGRGKKRVIDMKVNVGRSETRRKETRCGDENERDRVRSPLSSLMFGSERHIHEGQIPFCPKCREH